MISFTEECMAKHGGYMGGMPGNMNNLMKQAQRMQRQMEESRKSLDEQEFTAKAGGGAVEVTVTGAKQLKKLTISKDAVDPEDVEMLQDMIMAAINEAMKQAEDAGEQLLGGVTGGLGF
jgi:DNA-binding YbaB/EbfC family protein